MKKSHNEVLIFIPTWSNIAKRQIYFSRWKQQANPVASHPGKPVKIFVAFCHQKGIRTRNLENQVSTDFSVFIAPF